MLRNSGAPRRHRARDDCLAELARCARAAARPRLRAGARDRRRRAEPVETRRASTPLARAARDAVPRPSTCAADGPQRAAADHVHLGHHRRPKGIVGANLRFCAAGMLADLFGYRPDERPYTGLSLHPRQRPGGDARAGAHAWACARVFSRRFTQVEAVGRVPALRLHHLLAGRRHGDRDLQRARRARTTPTTRCAWW